MQRQRSVFPIEQIHEVTITPDPTKIYKVTPLVKGFECLLCGFKGGSNRRDYLVQHLSDKKHLEGVNQQRLHKICFQNQKKKSTHQKTTSLTQLIIDNAIFTGCQHAHSYKSTERCLRFISRTIASILSGWDFQDHQVGVLSACDVLKRSGMKKAARSLRRLCSLGKSERVNQEPARSVLVRDCTNIGKRVATKISQKVIADMTAVLQQAKYIGGACDESVVTGKTRPMFLNLQLVTSRFEWRMIVAGQTNTTGNGTGAENALNIVTMLRRVGLAIEDVLTWGTDGCYSMRSNLPGVDARAVGDSMMAALKETCTKRLLALHCLLHIHHLSVRGGIKAEIPFFWEKHIRALYTWGARSVKRQHEFSEAHRDALERTKELLELFGRVDEMHSWEWTRFDRYVIIRWETMVKCLRSSLINWPGARSVANVQREAG